ncbi:MAG: hypothetical protein AB7O55_21340 [Lautropia sp.]
MQGLPKLDRFDLNILAALQANGRMTTIGRSLRETLLERDARALRQSDGNFMHCFN